MSTTPTTRRVALAVTDQSSFEGDIVEGVLAYDEHADHWRFVGHEGRPFAAFEQIDLAAIDGLIVNAYDPAWVSAIRDAGAVTVSDTVHGMGLPCGGDAAAMKAWASG